MPISSKVYRRPDPAIYDQRYLMSQGIAVTWDNPDIQLFREGAPVSSESLDADTNYEVVARIWNNSVDAPAVHMPVSFSYLTFGIGTTRIPIAETIVDLPVKGAPGHPAFTKAIWHTPTTPGHYCLLVELIWGDDANPNNNIGQENTNVKKLNSPHAQFQFPLNNDAQRTRELRLEADAYRLPGREPCGQQPAQDPEMTNAEIIARRRAARARHNRANFPVPPGWRVDISPKQLVLDPGQEQLITVDVTAPDNFSGRKTFNINAFEGQSLVGGVSLFVEG